MRIAVLNLCRVTNEVAELIADAMRLYLVDVCAAWELAPIPVEFMPGVKAAPAGYVGAALLDSPDTAGALGYHSRDPSGRPFMRSFLDVVPAGLALHDPSGRGGSLAAVALHEAAETAVDPDADEYRDVDFLGPDGHVHDMLAAEVCDPVQEEARTMLIRGRLVDVPNFVYPAWFDESTPAGEQLDYFGTCKKPLELRPGGYVIVHNNRKDSSVFAAGGELERFSRVTHREAPAAWRGNLAGHPAGRSTRRLKKAAR